MASHHDATNQAVAEIVSRAKSLKAKGFAPDQIMWICESEAETLAAWVIGHNAPGSRGKSAQHVKGGTKIFVKAAMRAARRVAITS